jgi:AraC-like DNA-binding protein
MSEASDVTGFGRDEYHAPPPALAEFVLYFWRREFPAHRAITVQPTLPDGCFDLLTVDDGAPYLMGPESVRADHPVPGGSTIVGVRLRPGVGARLFGSVASELVDRSAYVNDLWRTPAPTASLRSAARVLSLQSDAHQPLIEALLPHLSSASPDDGVRFGVDWLACHPRAPVDALCLRLGWSSREVRRRFTSALGFGPKVMQRMLRFQRALTEARRAGVTTLSRIAPAAGYSDEAHMVREFRALANTTPGVMLSGPFDPTLEPMLPQRWPDSRARTFAATKLQPA